MNEEKKKEKMYCVLSSWLFPHIQLFLLPRYKKEKLEKGFSDIKY